MSEIEKLYENAEIEYGSCLNYSRFEQCCNSPFCDSGMCPNGISGEKHPFTAEKQLELIKWLIQEVDHLELWYFDGTFDFDLGEINAKGVTFEEALAKLINSLWQSLTDVEKEQIRDILKG